MRDEATGHGTRILQMFDAGKRGGDSDAAFAAWVVGTERAASFEPSRLGHYRTGSRAIPLDVALWMAEYRAADPETAQVSQGIRRYIGALFATEPECVITAPKSLRDEVEDVMVLGAQLLPQAREALSDGRLDAAEASAIMPEALKLQAEMGEVIGVLAQAMRANGEAPAKAEPQRGRFAR